MHRLSRLVGLNASCFLVVLALGANGCNDRKRSGGDNDAGDAGSAGASESGAGGDVSSSGGTATTGGTDSGGTDSGGTDSGTPGSGGVGGEMEVAGSGGTSGESGSAGTGGTSGSGGTAGTFGGAGNAGVGGGGAPALGRSAARLVPGGTIMKTERFRLIGSMSNGIAEGTSSASSNYELHGFVTGAH
jgi:hypothetical protein